MIPIIKTNTPKSEKGVNECDLQINKYANTFNTPSQAEKPLSFAE